MEVPGGGGGGADHGARGADGGQGGGLGGGQTSTDGMYIVMYLDFAGALGYVL